MRMLKQACLSMLLVVLTLVAVSFLRFNLAPAQQRQGEASTRSGDTNCDGKVDITDPIIVLNWLFGDGPEPCAMAQTDTCCEELRTRVEALDARVVSPRNIVAFLGTAHWNTSGTQTIYTVPSDKWFVLTSITYVSRSEAPPLVTISEEGQGGIPGIPGRYTKVDAAPGYLDPRLGTGSTWTTGMAFPPGTEIALGLATSGETLTYYINGYLTGE